MFIIPVICDYYRIVSQIIVVSIDHIHYLRQLGSIMLKMLKTGSLVEGVAFNVLCENWRKVHKKMLMTNEVNLKN